MTADRATATRRVVAGTTMAAALLGGCGGSPAPRPVEPVQTTPEGQRSYNREELAVFREAVRRVAAFESANQRFLAAGRATRRAKVFYRDHLLEWQPDYEQLQTYEREGIRIAHHPRVLSTTATSIKSFQDNAAEVVLTRCTDQSDLGMTKAGRPVPATYVEPVVQEVVVHRHENRTWFIGGITTTGATCTG